MSKKSPLNMSGERAMLGSVHHNEKGWSSQDIVGTRGHEVTEGKGLTHSIGPFLPRTQRARGSVRNLNVYYNLL